MDVFKSEVVPASEYQWGEASEFDEYDLEELYKTNAQAAFYWYVTGSYEGSGQLLILKDGSWYIHDCGHCSCYGPTEHLELSNPIADSLAGMREKFTDDSWKEVEPLVLLAESKGYGSAPKE